MMGGGGGREGCREGVREGVSEGDFYVRRGQACIGADVGRGRYLREVLQLSRLRVRQQVLCPESL